MDGEPSPGGTEVSTPQDPEALREQIASTREELGDTVEALAHKADVKAQAREQVEQTKAQVSEKVDQTREAVGAKADDLLGRAREVSPETARSAASTAAQKSRENPLPVAALGAFAIGFIAGRISSR